MMPTRCKIYTFVLLLVAASLGVWHYGATRYHAGYAKRDDEAKQAEAQLTRLAQDRYDRAAADALTRERALRAALDDETTKRQQENADHEKIIADYRARVAAGSERLRVAVAGCTVSGNTTGADTGPGARSETGQRADIMPGTADDLLGIAGRIAGLVRRYDAVVNAYERARAECNR